MATNNDILEYLADKVSLIGKELTMSNANWSSGSCTITDASKYSVLLLYAGAPMIALRATSGEKTSIIHAYSVTPISNGQVIRSFDLRIDGDELTFQNNSQMTHSASSNHGAKSSTTVTQCFGLIPLS